MTLVGSAGGRGAEPAAALDDHVAPALIQQVRRKPRLPGEIGSWREPRDFLTRRRESDVGRTVEITEWRLPGERQRDVPSDRTDPEHGPLGRPSPGGCQGGVVFR